MRRAFILLLAPAMAAAPAALDRCLLLSFLHPEMRPTFDIHDQIKAACTDLEFAIAIAIPLDRDRSARQRFLRVSRILKMNSELKLLALIGKKTNASTMKGGLCTAVWPQFAASCRAVSKLARHGCARRARTVRTFRTTHAADAARASECSSGGSGR